ncbi:MAG: hypothetical protein M4579_005066 [Chaenotheca gracillima]|nr:MAG: hypothetical protein M4579_005066 [Chaenotheca gracillima]
MSNDFASSNPFRRRATADISPHLSDPQDSASSQRPELSSKQTTSKKVRVISPPSAYIEADLSIHDSPPTPLASEPPRLTSPPPPGNFPEIQAGQALSTDPFLSESDRDDQTQKNTYTNSAPSIGGGQSAAGGPANPFQPLQDVAEAAHSAPSIDWDKAKARKPASEGPSKGVVGKASMDVDAFKRLLLTGNTGQSASTGSGVPPSARSNQPPIAGDGGSSTDTSSLSRQSIMEPPAEIAIDTPRTSHEISVSDDERLRLVGGDASNSSGKKKPPPPRTRHGKLIKANAPKEGSTSSHIQINEPESAPSGPAKDRKPQMLPPPSPLSPTNINKPLPTTPPTPTKEFSTETDQQSKSTKETAVASDEALPSIGSPPRKVPPAPPLARRHSQRLPMDSNRSRSNSARSFPSVEEINDDAKSTASQDKSSEARVPPPPPPARRPTMEQRQSSSGISGLRRSQTASVSSRQSPDENSSMQGLQAPNRNSSLHRNSSSSSKRSSTILPLTKMEDVSSGSGTQAPPPLPPPRRQRASSRSSIETSGSPAPPVHRRSGEKERTSFDSGRRTSGTYAETLSEEPSSDVPKGLDVLADLTALQREVDELRGKFAR